VNQSEYRLSLPARTENDDDPAVAAILSKAKAKIGMIPNMYANMANVPGLLETYLTGYDAFRAHSGLTPAEQETVLLSISRANGCNYCMAAHSAVADIAKVPSEITDALRAGQPLPDAKLDTLARFTTAMVATRGLPAQTHVETFLAAGYTETHILQIVLALAVKTISNYSNHLFHTPVDEVFAYQSWEG
jgi:uncharacterized peroxidase-related enzyme